MIGEDIADIEFSWPIGMPLVRAMGNGLWEVRISISGGKIARMLICVQEQQMVLLHGSIKKTQKTAEQEFKLALGRMREGKT